MKILKHRSFHLWAQAEHTPDKTLKTAIEEISQGLYEAHLGSGLYKKRIASPGKGKRSSYRTLIAFKKNISHFSFMDLRKTHESTSTKKKKKFIDS